MLFVWGLLGYVAFILLVMVGYVAMATWLVGHVISFIFRKKPDKSVHIKNLTKKVSNVIWVGGGFVALVFVFWLFSPLLG